MDQHPTRFHFTPLSIFRVCALTLALFSLTKSAVSQTDFAPGEIMFTGYNSDGTQSFSFVLLKDVTSGTVIYITDRGWTNASGFRIDNTEEGTIALTFNNDYPCGTEIIFTDSNDANDWDNPVNQAGTIVGTVVIQAGDANGMVLTNTGDQLFIYQLPTPVSSDQSSFITAIHMDGAWAGLSNSDNTSALPNGLSDFEVVVFATEVDNAKYDCSPNEGTPAYLQSQISNENLIGQLKAAASDNWNTNDATAFNLSTTCGFCCMMTSLTGPTTVVANQVFTITIDGMLPSGESWQLYTSGCGVGSPVQTTMTNTFTITAPATEQTITYYVRASTTMECGGECATLTVCVENTPLAACTNCTGNIETCNDCFLPAAVDNPDLDSGCYDIKLVFILDESGSIGGNEPQVRDGVLAFLNSLNGQDIQIHMIEFSEQARFLTTTYTTINSAFIQQVEWYFNDIVPLNGNFYQPLGGTNWHAAMAAVDPLENPDMIMFFTDGIPTGWGATSVDFCGNGSTTQVPEIVNPVKFANKFKSEDTHMFMLGVGSGIDSYNLSLMSGPTEYDPGTNTIGTSDYSIGDFAELAADLEAFVEELCQTPLIIYKEVTGPACDSMIQFRFVLYNPGTESAATIIQTIDTLPSGYENPYYSGSNPFVKVCFGVACEAQGVFIHPDAFLWTVNSVPPGGYDTLLITASLVPGGEFTNIAWAQGSNTVLASDTLVGTLINDDTDPSIECPDNVEIQCNESTLPANTGFAISNDGGNPAPPVTWSDVTAAGSCPQAYFITRSWLTTDGCDNTAGCVQDIEVRDELLPAMTCPANVTITCVASTLPAATGAATATDFCDGSPLITFSDVTSSGSCPGELVIQRTWTALDDCGNDNTCMQTITVDDSAAPSLNCPANITISCTASTLPANTGTATGTDLCDGSPDITYTDVNVNGSCPQERTIQRTWRIEDNCGNITTCLQSIAVEDSSGPVMTCPPNITIDCDESTSVGNTGNATASDGCAPTTTIVHYDYDDVPPATSPEMRWVYLEPGQSTGSCTSNTDCEAGIICVGLLYTPGVTGIMTSYTTGFLIPCVNNGNPIISNASCAMSSNVSVTLDCMDSGLILMNSSGNTGSFPITAHQPAVIHQVCFQLDEGETLLIEEEVVTDLTTSIDIPGVGSITEIPAYTNFNIDVDAFCSEDCGYPVTIYRRFIGTDPCQNHTSCYQQITRQDLSAPVQNCPPNVTISCTASTLPVNTGTTTAIDNCDVAPVTIYADVTTASPTCSQEYTIQRTWTSTDACGNVSSCTQTIVIDDAISPALNCPANVTIACTASSDPTNTGQATGSDNCDLAVAFSHTDIVTPGGCPQEYTIARTWTAEDECGNISTCVQTIFVDDAIAPALNCPANVTIACTDDSAPVATGQATSTDNCDMSVTPTSSDVIVNGPCPQTYTIQRTWTAADDCGNSTTCLQVISVQDIIAPALTCPVNITIECTENTLPAETGNGSATDACDPSPTVEYNDVIIPGSCAQSYTIERTWSAEDACGNLETCVQIITVQDTQAPDLTCVDDVTIECTAVTLPSNTGNAAADDLCDATPDVTYSDAVSGPMGCAQQYTITRTWMAEDECGNTSTCIQIITVDDSVAPVLGCAPNVTIECTENTLPVNTGNTTVSDNCDASPDLVYDDVTLSNPSCAQAYTIERTWTATDECGNESTCLQIISVVDTQAPDITCPANVTVECTGSTDPEDNGFATATDACDAAPEVEYFDLTFAVPGTYDYRIERLWTATDACGNAASCVQDIYVENPVLPAIEGAPFDTICSGQMVMFEAEDPGLGPVTYSWNFGSGASPATANGIGPHNVTYTYNPTNGSTGAWVLLTVTIPGCLSATDTVSNVHVNAIPNAAIMATPSGAVCITETKTFQPVAPEIPGATYTWNFGVGASIPSAMGYGPHMIQYSTVGTKTVTLTIQSNEAGSSCSAMSSQNFVVNLCAGLITGRVFVNTTGTDTTGIGNVRLRLYADNNQDGIRDNNTFIKEAFTSVPSGVFNMAIVTPGHYVLSQTQPAGYFSLYDEDYSEDFDAVPNTNPNNDTIPVTILPNETDTRNYFAEVTNPGIISGYVFQDLNNSMTPQAGEGIQGASVHLWSDNDANGIPDAGGFLETAITNATGFYTFGNLPADDYVLLQTQPVGFLSVKDFDPTPDSDNVPNTNMTNDTLPVFLTIAETDAENYFIETAACGQLVTTTADNAPGSLRYAIECASTENWDTIRFHPSLENQTLEIEGDRIEISKNLYIHSDIVPNIMIESTINGAFFIPGNKFVEFRNINFTSGHAGEPGAQFENFGHLILWNCNLFPNASLPANETLIYSGTGAIFEVKGSAQVNED